MILNLKKYNKMVLPDAIEHFKRRQKAMAFEPEVPDKETLNRNARMNEKLPPL